MTRENYTLSQAQSDADAYALLISEPIRSIDPALADEQYRTVYSYAMAQFLVRPPVSVSV